MRRFVLLHCFTLTFVLGTALAGELSFSQAPAATKDGDGARITFAVSAKTDVEVAVVNKDGKVVRHLAAGVLGGKKPPPEPLKEGLKQELVWDGKDDFGEKAEGAPFKVRVRAGTTVKFGRTLSDSPYVINTVRGVATDEDGRLYVYHQSFNRGPSTVQVFEDDGTYVRTAFPVPSNLPREKLGDLIHWDTERDRMYPRNYNDIYPRFLPYSYKGQEWVGLIPVVTKASGILLFAPQWIFRLDFDGSTGGRPLRFGFLFPRGISPYDAASKAINVTASLDGKTLYGGGPLSKIGKDGKPYNAHWPPGQVFSMKLDDQDYMKPFARIAPATGKKGARVAGMATDAKGNVYVCEPAGARVVVLDAAGKQIAEVPVENPHRLAVHPKSGAMYVLTRKTASRRQHHYKLFKFTSLKDTKAAATQDLAVGGNGSGFIALTFSGEKTGVWLAGLKRGAGRLETSDVTRYEEKDGAFVATVKLHEKSPSAIGAHDVIAVDPNTEDVYINDDYSGMYRYNGLTGEGGSLHKVRKGFSSTELAVGPKGNLYARTGPSYSGPFERLDRDLKPVPLPSGTHYFTKYIYSRYGAGHAEKGVGVGMQGQAYVMNMFGWQRYAVYGCTPKGEFMEGRFLKGKLGAYAKSKARKPNSAVIGPVPDTCGGLRVDTKGNIYVGMLMLPPGFKGPKVLARDCSWCSLVGSIVKFGPEGGEWICTNKGLAARGPKGIKTEIPAGAKGVKMENGHFMSGAMAAYAGVAPFSGAAGTSETGRPPLGRENCACRSPRFDIDRYDRLYIPNAVTSSVRIVDNNGNEILDLGRYGNYDSAGPKSKIPTPEIPLAWPIGVGASEEHVYICDQVNMRIVRADKIYGLQKVLEVK